MAFSVSNAKALPHAKERYQFLSMVNMRSALQLDIFEESEDEGLQSEDDSDDELPYKARLGLLHDLLVDSISADE